MNPAPFYAGDSYASGGRPWCAQSYTWSCDVTLGRAELQGQPPHSTATPGGTPQGGNEFLREPCVFLDKSWVNTGGSMREGEEVQKK